MCLGEAHTTYSGARIDARQQKHVNCRCQCYCALTAAEKQKIFSRFNQIKDHESQNVYLRGREYVSVNDSDKIRRRPRNADAHERRSFSYKVTVERKSLNVCKAAFLGLHGIAESRLKRKVLQLDVNLNDGRGKHENHHRMDESKKQRVKEHIENFPARESHYSRSKNEHKTCLDSSLTISELHRLFIKKIPDLETVCKYSYYRDVFNDEYNISFGYPRSGICNLCEKLQVAIKAAELASDATAKCQSAAEHELHIRKADVFNMQLNEVTEEAKAMGSNCDTAVIAMDHQKNLSLPLTGVSQEYYKRQLWLHNLCIHDNVTNHPTMFVNAEHFARKSSNEVISCLDFYISTLGNSTKKLHIFVDNYFSQNKNRYLVAYLQVLANTKLEEVHVHYPLPGHSRMRCDRDFGLIEKKRRRKDRVDGPSEWVKLIKKQIRLTHSVLFTLNTLSQMT